mmetsp:Transcript_3349/g.3484  ORF Transcript_3349/g.3484 Transcript_3349/m.3484 type:complete len:125 (-) Transcript_3349:267-641(-)
MEDICISLEREFKRVYNDLDFVAHRLEGDFKRSDESSPNILALVRRMHELETKLSKLQGKCENLQTLRKSVVLTTCQNAIQNSNLLSKLSESVGCDIESDDALHTRDDLRETFLRYKLIENGQG